MKKPEVSILIPMYNRNHYIVDCINSALNQDFEDYEIIVTDDCSPSNSFEFVQETFSEQLKTGKLKNYRNPERLGELGNIKSALAKASGKYIQILHDDDILLPHALKHLYEVAEKFKADVIHGAVHLESPHDGIIQKGTKLIVASMDYPPINELVAVPNDPLFKFKHWLDRRIFVDNQYNFFNRQFAIENNIFPNRAMPELSSLCWMMKANVIIKTPVAFYIRRESPDSSSNIKRDEDYLEGFIEGKITFYKIIDEILSDIPFLKDNEILRDIAKINMFVGPDDWLIKRRGFYKNGISTKAYHAVKRAFEKYYGEDAFLPAFLFHYVHAMQYNREVKNDFFDMYLSSLENNNSIR